MNAASPNENVLIVGAGIIGIASAHYLSKAGYQVTVIDQGTIAGACSHGNCGYVCPSHVLPLTEPGAISTAVKSFFNRNAPFRVKPRLNPALWKWMWQFARRCNKRQMLEAAVHLQSILDSSMVEYRQLISTESLDCQWKDSGLLYVLRTNSGLQHFEETDQLLTKEFGVSAKLIDGQDLPTFDPALKPGLAGAFLYEGDSSVRPDRLSASWATLLKQRGVNFVEDCQLQKVVKTGGRVTQLETSQGAFQADGFVFALGA